MGIKKLKLLKSVICEMGFFWILGRLLYELKLKIGLLRLTMPAHSWNSVRIERYFDDFYKLSILDSCFFRMPFDFFAIKDSLPEYDVVDVNPVSRANDILENHFIYFSEKLVKLQAPLNWHENPFETVAAYPKMHWSLINDSCYGDIKNVWELGRFTFVYPLLRAYLRTGNDIYVEKFWTLWESWMEDNPPNVGVHWKCGQEISIRLLNCIVAICAFYKSSCTTDARLESFLKFIFVSAERIEKNINYAIQQKNNHGVAEAIGIWTVGVLFPTSRYASKWVQRGSKVLERLGLELIYEDGSYAQHSMNYTRVTLQYYLWMFVISKKFNIKINLNLESRLRLAYQFLYQLHNSIDGRLPNYGANDGSLIYYFNNCDFLDYRPLLQCWHYYFTGERCFDSGVWDEELLFLFGSSAETSNIQKLALYDLHAEIGGYYTIRNLDSLLFLRCNQFKHRPSQSDQLHVDIWWKGVNVAIDPGTYSYHNNFPWDHGLSLSKFHNTVIVDDLDQMNKFGKFLWTSWSSGVVKCQQVSQSIKYWEVEQNSYERLADPVYHKRAIIALGEDYWVIFDYLEASEIHHFTLHWLLNDFNFRWDELCGSIHLSILDEEYTVLVGSTSSFTTSIVRADQDSAEGWQSTYYQSRVPALSLRFSSTGNSILFWTVFGPKVENIQFEEDHLMFKTHDASAKISLSLSQKKIIESIIIEKETGVVLDIVNLIN